MTSFSSELRNLVDEWRAKGESDKSLMEALRDVIESLNDLRSSREPSDA